MLNCLILLYVFVALFTDLQFRKVFNLQILIGLVAGLIWSLHPSTSLSFLDWLLGVGCAGACLMPFYLLKGMAAGDVKLLMAIGGLVGYPTILDVLIYTFVFGGLFALLWVIYSKKLTQLIGNLNVVLMNLFVSTSLKVSIETNAINQRSLGRMPYVTAIAASVCFVMFRQA